MSAHKNGTSPVRNKTATIVWRILIAAALLLLPWLGNDYVVFLACLCGVHIVATLGLNITTGYAGLLSLSHAGFLAVGAYTTVILSNNTGLPFLVLLLVAGFVASVVGCLFGLPSFRVKGVYLAVATLAAQFTIIFALRHGGEFTGGDGGLVMKIPTIAGFALDSNRTFYFVVLAVVLLALWITRNLFRTRIGRAFVAIRERDFTAEVFGIPLATYKALAFMIGAFFAGVAGALLAGFMRVVTPDQFSLTESVFYLAAVVVGGVGSIAGSVVGAVFMTLMPEALMAILERAQSLLGFKAVTVIGPMKEIVFGAMIVGFLVLEPHGLIEAIRRMFARLNWRSPANTAANAVDAELPVSNAKSS
ncbi:MAG: branched-chain amino acid ABC transporter permease [Hydrogenophaga sp.]|uniref:branched-chain amino acid ABC transporter permease n=1 Tax=Hydrogenophaga sp. TaxID=1904254 RepID=UPI0040363AA1